MDISIKIHYKKANINYFTWANEEDKIDFSYSPVLTADKKGKKAQFITEIKISH